MKLLAENGVGYYTDQSGYALSQFLITKVLS